MFKSASVDREKVVLTSLANEEWKIKTPNKNVMKWQTHEITATLINLNTLNS